MELENWKVTRAHGRGRFLARTTARRCLTLGLPVAVILLLAHWRHARDEFFLEDDALLIWAFAGITILIGLGDGLLGWLTCEQEYARKTSFLGQPAPARETITGESNGDKMFPKVPGLPASDSDRTFVDATLILEARGLQNAHERGFADLDKQCAKFDPIFKMTLAKDTFLLAAKAGVGEKAAFLTLMSQFEN
jgi:hypothetical protein